MHEELAEGAFFFIRRVVSSVEIQGFIILGVFDGFSFIVLAGGLGKAGGTLFGFPGLGSEGNEGIVGPVGMGIDGRDGAVGVGKVGKVGKLGKGRMGRKCGGISGS